jgi:paired amphipathic helix protein Sin3a
MTIGFLIPLGHLKTPDSLPIRRTSMKKPLHKSKEERHEYDFHIEAIVCTIQILEPIMAWINLMDADERTHSKLKPGLGGQGKSVLSRRYIWSRPWP